ncbi:MAG: PepSY-associated TM helix domain-containing protein [Pyrinomonadaceae bacterium]
MKVFRKAIFWIHLCCGVAGGIVIFIMCVTGAALSFEKLIIENVEHDQRFVVVGERRLTANEILAKIVEAKPKAKPSSMVISSDPTAALAVSMGRDGQVFVDPYTGAITGEGNKNVRSFFSFMTDMHRWIALSGDGRPVGKAITGACNLMFLFLAISGIYIWMPRHWSLKHIRPNIVFRSTKSGRARDFNWHNTIGFWTSLVLIVLTMTAAVISYQWAGNLIYTLTGNEIPQQQQAPPPAAPQNDQAFVVPANLNDLWAKAESHTTGWKTISLRLPLTKDAVFSIDEAKSLNIFGRSALTLDAATAAVSKWEPYAEQNSARQIRSWSRFTHTGESLGIVGQIVGFFACIGGAFLVYTGLALSVRRPAAFIRRRRAAV